MKKALTLLIFGSILIVSPYARGNREGTAADTTTELLISAAASLTNCMQELINLYKGVEPRIIIRANFGSSGALQQQIEQGGPADLFFSAGMMQMDALKARGLMRDHTVKHLLENRPVLIAPQGAAATSFESLIDESIQKIGVGEPKSVPVGQYTAQIFTSLGLTGAIASKLIFAKDVREVLTWVETGNVDAGIVYETDAKIGKNVVICAIAPEGSYEKVIYAVGVTKNSRHPGQAQQFIDFLCSDMVKTVFARYGFTVL